MADIHEKRPEGIFIPFDKLLQQQSEKLDKILETLRDIEKSKLDIVVFDGFRISYEERHERLKTRTDTLERELLGREELIKEFRESQDKIEELEKDKAERDAIKAQNRYYLAGGGLVGLLVLVNLSVNILQVASGHGI